MKRKDWNGILKTFTDKKLKKDQLLILLLVGILLLVIAIPAQPEREEKEEQQTDTAYSSGDYAGDMERRLENILSQIWGAGEVEVMITLESSAEKVVEKDRSSQTDTVTESGSTESTRTSKSSSTSESSVYGGSGNQEEPYVSKEISPKVRGVLVVASGGDKAVVKQNIMEAVQALFDIDTHKIRIMKKNENQSENQEGKQ